jgi:LPS export ABC transporter protein LptC
MKIIEDDAQVLKHIIYLGLLLLLAISGIHCTEFEDTDEQPAVTDLPDQESWDNNIFFTRDDKRRAVLTAGYIAKYNSKNYTILKDGVRVDFYNEEGVLRSILTSEEGKVYDDKQDMYANGHVVVRSENGTTLFTDELFWNNNEQKIISKVPVKITTLSDTLYGDTFRSDPDLVDYEITNAHGTSDHSISIGE